ncbi:cytochrome b N-terminal domain-containing protein [Anatilimnocola sp. NA78]|uniref:cytochrome b N-terminal domain-containing protein n=1 Tax=Anatilimnocola sp. NA78 TaxID=3415683 RepID=UPI003CE5A53D
MVRSSLRWLVDRFGLGPIWDHLLDRNVPKDPWYHGDGMALLVLLSVLVITGVVLSLGYCPAVDEAYQSVKYITERQTLGSFVRGLHYWSGGLMVVMLFLHLCRQLLNGGYKSPREGTWLIGVFLLFIVLTTSLLGYVLRWDQRGFYGLKVLFAALQSVPVLGEQLVLLIQGGPEVTSLTLSRVYSLHVVILPMLLIGLVGYHMYLVILHGTTTLAERKEPIETVEEQRELYQEQADHPVKGEVFFPTAVIKISPWSIVSLTLALGLALTLGPRALLAPASSASTEPVSEEWWFAWYSGLVALLPPSVAPTFQWLFPVAVFVGLAMLPLVDRSPLRGWKNRPIATLLVSLLVLAVIGLSWFRYQSPWTPRSSAGVPTTPAGFELAYEAEQGRQLFRQYGCTNCHSVAGSGGTKVGSDLAQLDTIYSQAELRQYILQPPRGVAMPSYTGRMSNDELEEIVAYVLVAQTFPRKQE